VTTMPDEITVSLLITIIALIIDLERRVARLETLINNIKNNRRREKA
jgi:heme exporter protein D